MKKKKDLKTMKTASIENFCEMFDRLVDLYPVVESALEDGETNF